METCSKMGKQYYLVEPFEVGIVVTRCYDYKCKVVTILRTTAKQISFFFMLCNIHALIMFVVFILLKVIFIGTF